MKPFNIPFSGGWSGGDIRPLRPFFGGFIVADFKIPADVPPVQKPLFRATAERYVAIDREKRIGIKPAKGGKS